ncbi:hypothetical protein M427DRAFT_141994 [Gonapodya prolifera JEL478]|uniref:Peroxin-3 n=1 Tax=Gonapodya prolifera (strain JEL478) TaxID=1344416 RepID=A0A139AXM6_GONPJ|nr:hypothetical protein M427DRAFT_141994 [Gonapodya prolifera JEL478]|eukprot:KXS21470.1 hypothetical protein M427DRAFT_141994 [Gonapodya prolifera JEL478]
MVLSALSSALVRHQDTIIYTSGIAVAGYVMAGWLAGKIRELSTVGAADRARENLARRFARNNQDTAWAAAALFPAVLGQLLEAMRVEELTARLQGKQPAAVGAARAALSAAAATVSGGVDGKPGSPAPAPVAVEQPLDKDAKLRLWNDLKILAFARTLASVYILNLLSILVQTQICLLGRGSYLESILSADEETPDKTVVVPVAFAETRRSPVDAQTEREFLSFSWYLINVGYRPLLERARWAVEETLGNVALKQPVTFDDFVTYIENARAKIELDEAPSSSALGRGPGGAAGTTPTTPQFHAFVQYVLPQPETSAEADVLAATSGTQSPTSPTGDVSPSLRRLLRELHLTFTSVDFAVALRSSLDASIEVLLSQFKTSTFTGPTQPPPPDTLPVVTGGDASAAALSSPAAASAPTLSVPLATLLPRISKTVHTVWSSPGAGLGFEMGMMGTGMGGNPYYEAIRNDAAVRSLAAVVFARWGEDGLMEGGDDIRGEF